MFSSSHLERCFIFRSTGKRLFWDHPKTVSLCSQHAKQSECIQLAFSQNLESFLLDSLHNSINSSPQSHLFTVSASTKSRLSHRTFILYHAPHHVYPAPQILSALLSPQYGYCTTSGGLLPVSPSSKNMNPFHNLYILPPTPYYIFSSVNWLLLSRLHDLIAFSPRRGPFKVARAPQTNKLLRFEHYVKSQQWIRPYNTSHYPSVQIQKRTNNLLFPPLMIFGVDLHLCYNL